MPDRSAGSSAHPKDLEATDDIPLADESKGVYHPDAAAYLHDVPQETEVNVATILKGSVGHRMNLFEKKAALINA